MYEGWGAQLGLCTTCYGVFVTFDRMALPAYTGMCISISISISINISISISSFRRSQCRAILGVGLRPFQFWDCGFESRRSHDSVFNCRVLSGTGLLGRADHSSRGFVPNMVCLSVIFNNEEVGYFSNRPRTLPVLRLI